MSDPNDPNETEHGMMSGPDLGKFGSWTLSGANMFKRVEILAANDGEASPGDHLVPGIIAPENHRSLDLAFHPVSNQTITKGPDQSESFQEHQRERSAEYNNNERIEIRKIEKIMEENSPRSNGEHMRHTDKVAAAMHLLKPESSKVRKR